MGNAPTVQVSKGSLGKWGSETGATHPRLPRTSTSFYFYVSHSLSISAFLILRIPPLIILLLFLLLFLSSSSSSSSYYYYYY
eukprot:6852108-Pyramimonas_sp.AAC.1